MTTAFASTRGSTVEHLKEFFRPTLKPLLGIELVQRLDELVHKGQLSIQFLSNRIRHGVLHGFLAQFARIDQCLRIGLNDFVDHRIQLTGNDLVETVEKHPARNLL